MIFFIISFLSSTIISFLLIRYLPLKGKITLDHVGVGPQKFHTHPVPRVGGVAIALGLAVAGIIMSLKKTAVSHEYWLLLISSIPAFSGGLIEDLTKKAGIKLRLVLSMLSAGVAFYLLDACVTKVNLPYMDEIFTVMPISIAFTVFGVAGVTNAINIIDGFNGIAGMVSLIILSVLGYVAFEVGDSFLLSVCLATGGSVLGFFSFNYPKGLIFLGDAGAYLIGFLIAELSVLLVARHPEVSPWFPLLLVAYPATETLFSIYRRKFLRNISPSLADAMHLHSLIFKRIVKLSLNGKLLDIHLKQNFMTAPYLWLLTMLTAVPALVFRKNTVLLIIFLFAFVIFYVWLYFRIVRFKTPKWLFVPLRWLKKRLTAYYEDN